MTTFNNIGLGSWLLRLCDKIGYRTPTPIQSMVINPILKGQSVIGTISSLTQQTPRRVAVRQPPSPSPFYSVYHKTHTVYFAS
jgi:hypothetical protein